MANSMKDLIMNEAELDDDEDDESFDEETGEVTRDRKREGRVDDSSEEEDDDDDEEEARRVRSMQLIPSTTDFIQGHQTDTGYYRSAKASSLTNPRRMGMRMWVRKSAERRRSAVGLSARMKNNSTRRISISSESQPGGSVARLPLHRYVTKIQATSSLACRQS